REGSGRLRFQRKYQPSFFRSLRPSMFQIRIIDTPTARSGGILASSRTACRSRSYTRSTSVYPLGMPYREQYSDAFVSDVYGCVVISVMTNATNGTSPETI